MKYNIILKNSVNGHLTYVSVKNKAIGYFEAKRAIEKSCEDYKSNCHIHEDETFVQFHNRQKENKRIQLEENACINLNY